MRSKLKKGIKRLTQKKRTRKVGLAPGTLVSTSPAEKNPAKVRLVSYGPDKVKDRMVSNAAECLEQTQENLVHWIDVNGTHDVALVEALGKGLDIHPLIQEDILNTGQRTKLETMGALLFLTPKMLSLKEGLQFKEESISIIIGPSWVLTFQEVDKPGDVWDPLRKRIHDLKSNFHTYETVDYLLYALLDAIVDQYFIILDAFEEQSDQLEHEILTDLKEDTLIDIQQLKSKIIRLRKSVWPLRDIIGQLQKGNFELIDKKTSIYYRDVHDHLSSIIESVEILRDLLTNMINLHVTLLSDQMNRVMKTLAMISTFFIPLTFLTGLYGMNFKNMPELDWKYGYFMVLSLMGVSVIFIFGFFKKKKWF